MAKHATDPQAPAPAPAAGAAGAPPGDGGDAAPAPPRRRRPSQLQLAVLVVVLIGAGAFAVVAARNRPSTGTVVTSLRPTGIPASVSTPTATLMALSPVQTSPAPGFDLVDQNGRRVSLASLRGKVVVLEFMDPHCTDICPIVSQEFVDASHDLKGLTGQKVVFMAINVNQYHASPAAMMAFSREHGLVTIPSWHFVTGPLAALKKAWRDYAISVEAPSPNADIIHTSAVYFIGPAGKERYLAMPQVDHTKAGKAYLPHDQVTQWGRGIAEVARSLLR